MSEREKWSKQGEWLHWLWSLREQDRQALERILGVPDATFPNGFNCTARCAMCYRAKRETWKIGPYCHRCGGGEELT